MLSILLLLELKISIDYYWGLAQKGWNQSCYVVGAKSVASGITLRPPIETPKQIYFLPVSPFSGQMVIMAHPGPWGPRYLVPARLLRFWCYSVPTYISEVIESGILVALQDVAKPDH